MKKTYIPTIGLEIHAELKTRSKMFCACKNGPDEEKPNVNVCPICLGHPGTLPVLNREAIRHVIAVGRALGGSIADYTEWDRKNYFYPDIPKGYQISQYKYPLVSGGALPVTVEGKASSVAITRIHLEEDTARSTHDARDDHSLVDFNRSGVPLMELVTEPVIRDAAAAVAFARELRLLLVTLGVAEANLEKGEMRVEANVSVASPEDTVAGKFGTKTEVKNLNSFRAVERAIAFEAKRQVELLEKGGKVVQETRGWDESSGTTYPQRAKESSHDYRYFPEPDLPKLVVSEASEFSAGAIAKSLPELPWAKRERFIKRFGMTDKEAEIFVVSAIGLDRYFEAVIKPFDKDAKKVKLAANYILNDYLSSLYLGEAKLEELNAQIDVNKISAASLSELVDLIADGEVSSRGAKDLILTVFKENPGVKDLFDGSFKDLAEKHGLVQKSDEGALKAVVEEVVKANPAVAADYKAGKASAIQFLIGQSMKATKGSGNPEIIKKLLVEILK